MNQQDQQTAIAETLEHARVMITFASGRPIWTRKKAGCISKPQPHEGWLKMSVQDGWPVWDWFTHEYIDVEPQPPPPKKPDVRTISVDDLPPFCWVRKTCAAPANMITHIDPVTNRCAAAGQPWIDKDSGVWEFSPDHQHWTPFRIG